MPNLTLLQTALTELGFTLESDQPHIAGERSLTGPIGGGHKVLLLGKDTEGRRVVIKASNDIEGRREIEHEHECRRVLHQIHFAYGTFLSPKELLYTEQRGYRISVTAFIEAAPFMSRPTTEQFALALKAFKAQESAHATTSSHVRLVRGTFGEMRAVEYLHKLRTYTAYITKHTHGLDEVLAEAEHFVAEHMETIEQYGGFLTHWDFTPQNMRIVGEDIYLLDHSSLHFGNKYEGWARFCNFMVLYNPALCQALVKYVRDNRTKEESLSLTLMRVYRLVELVRYYAGWLTRTEGNMRELAEARITLWSAVLRAVLKNTELPPTTLEIYKEARERLRSPEEKQRQIGLH